MDRPAAPGGLHVRWQASGDAPHADQIAAAILRHNRRAATPTVRPWILYATFVFVGGVLVASTWPAGLVLVVVAVALLVLVKVVGPRQLAKNLRNQPVAHEPYTVTLDREGFHVVSPSVADHLRWSVFESATLDEDLLVLRNRGTAFVRAIPLAALDPAVDRAALVAEIGRLIAASAPAGAG